MFLKDFLHSHRQNTTIYALWKEKNAMEYDLAEWESISKVFQRMFSGLGRIESLPDKLTFNSDDQFVITSVCITTQGDLIASMPLHGVESKFERIFFSHNLDSFEVSGPNFQYKYQIPFELLNSRN